MALKRVIKFDIVELPETSGYLKKKVGPIPIRGDLASARRFRGRKQVEAMVDYLNKLWIGKYSFSVEEIRE